MFSVVILLSLVLRLGFLIQESVGVPLPSGATCNVDEFRCEADGECISASWVCDSSYDCLDKSDEKDCAQDSATTISPVDIICNVNEFKCVSDGVCIPLEWVCDGSIDCFDNSDELTCGSEECKSWETRCKETGHCIKQEYLCDGEADCIDMSDEENCPSSTTSPPVATIPTTEYIEEMNTTMNINDPKIDEPVSLYYVNETENSTDITNYNQSEVYLQYSEVQNTSDFSEDSMNYTSSIFYTEDLFNLTSLYNETDDFNETSLNQEDEISNEYRVYSVSPEIDYKSSTSNSYKSPHFFTFPVYVVTPLKEVEIPKIDTYKDSSSEEIYEYTTSPKTVSAKYEPSEVGEIASLQLSAVTEKSSPSVTSTLSTTLTFPTTLKTTTPSTTPIRTTTSTTTTTTSTTTTIPTTPYPCGSGEYFCQYDRICIPVEWRCDSTEDCWDGSDERNCNQVQCPYEMFQCHDTGQCIYKAWVCDGRNDCNSGSDEMNCK